MKFSMKHKFTFLFITFFAVLFSVNAQNYDSKWTISIGSASVIYQQKHKFDVGGAYVDQLPRLTIATYFTDEITLEAGFASNALDHQKYITFDGTARYNFGSPYEKVIPYVFIGGSFIQARVLTPTLNFGVGNTFWISSHYGLNVQFMYKFSENRFESQRSHFYPSMSLVYSFKARNMNPRLWHIRR